MKNRKTVLAWGLLVIILLLLPAGCSWSIAQGPREPAPASPPAAATAAGFAAYREEPVVNVKPAVPAYRVAPDLGNVTNAARFKFSPAARELLARNGFVVVPAQYDEFFWIYEMNRYEEYPIPNFVTTDAMLHNYHLYFSHLLRTLEKEKLRPELQALAASMLSGAEEQYRALKGTAWETAARRNVAFFAVAARLLDPAAAVPAYVRPEAERELKLIAEHRETQLSPVMNMGAAPDPLEGLKEDYTQYIPRGHYDRSDELRSYFKAMMWYGRMTFRAKDDSETRSAALITLLLRDRDRFARWERIYEPTGFFVGKSDDPGYYQYAKLLKEAYGKEPSLSGLTKDTAKWTAFRAAVEKLEPPAINSIPVFDENIQPDREREIKGFRFMGQRFTLDAAVFQRLIYREVKENGKGERRLLPKGLDIPAAMGSEEAYAILKDMGETDYRGYPENMQKIRDHIAGLDRETWTQNLYWSWLYTLRPLTEPKGEGYPSFMRNQSWTRKQLAAYLGSWTELKHDTILYAKQVYAEMGGGGYEIDDRGYVEPEPAVYARLAALTRMTIDGLAARDLLNERDRASLERMEQLALALKAIAEKELTNQPLTEQEHDLIRSFGGQLEHFWLEALRDEGVDHRSATYENPAAVVADVATAPPDTVLEEATGHVWEIYAVVPVDGKLRIAKGAVYSYYEFPWAASDRLTDKKWQGMLRDGQAPEPPAWTRAFTAPPIGM
ncbi:MAG: DUF3160 domain-containing protein [Thermoanaerobacterales bacterium]|nr:DUF3160 domain-containing protein [Thermoanaerobacterales bacterium]